MTTTTTTTPANRIISMEDALHIIAMFPDDDENDQSEEVNHLMGLLDWSVLDDKPSPSLIKGTLVSPPPIVQPNPPNKNISLQARKIFLMKNLNDQQGNIHTEMKIGISMKQKRLKNHHRNSDSSEISSISESTMTESEEEEEESEE